MNMLHKLLHLAVLFHVLIFVKSEVITNYGRDYQGYFPFEDSKKLEYQILQYSPNQSPINGYSENEPSSTFVEKGLNVILLKLGILGIIKAALSLAFLLFLAKLPILLLKVAVIKSFFFPFLVAPLLVYFFTNQMNLSSDDDMNQKPQVSSAGPQDGAEMNGMSGMNGMNAMNIDMETGRQLTDNLTSLAWQSVKMFAESDQCVERISCVIGASNSDSSMGKSFDRMLKFLQYSSSSALQERMISIREAFNKGSRTLICSPEEYKCQNPEILIQHGSNKVKII